MPRLRSVGATDLHALYAISLATGFAGTNAAHLYKDGMLMGHIYSAPYACLEPDLALVAEDVGGVAGFAVGATDTEGWETRLEREWWPDLRKQYPDPEGTPSDWTADQKRCAMIHHPERTPTEIAHKFPAHVHVNLLPRLQHQGLGSRLLRAWLDLARDRGALAVHAGVNRANVRALQFWVRHGFRPLTSDGGATRTAWMGLQMSPD
jgi:GNAT superfamily N-acetyltransferase